MSAWTPPEEFDEYRLLRPLGQGRTGQVWLANDSLLERTVAIKFIPAPDAVWLQRFLVEARAAARIQHPNVVTLYRVGQVEDRAYLVSEYIRGDSLDRVQRPVTPERLLQIANDLARGLSAAHRGGVLHRDIKPGNAVLAESGDVKLLDFGLAKIEGVQPETTSGPVGTPYFIAPEIWRGEDATARSDLWSLGVVLYELAAGKGPFRDVPQDDLPRVVQERDPRPLAELVPGIDERIAAAIDRCLRREPAQRFASADELLDALELIRAERWGPPPADQNPYRGLEAFQAEHRALFFGRRRDLRAALDRLRREPVLLVTGDSGVGKSSLCLAGLLPALQDGALGDGRTWRTMRMVPGRRPATSLATAIAPIVGTDADALEQHMRADPARLARGLRLRLGASAGLVVYVDQLEELVTLSPPQEAEVAGRALAAIADDLPGVRLVASARSDFLTRLAGLPGFGDAVQRSLYLLRGLRKEEIREVVVGPARVTGTRFESEELVKTLVESTAATESGLPLLQFALAELWQARDPATQTITAASLRDIGGVSGALARHADGVIASLLPDQRVAARRILLRLVTLEGTRARRTDEELALDERGRVALEALVRGRLVVAREVEGGAQYEIAHEALLAGWGTLAAWLAEALEARALRGRLEAAASDWERAGQRKDSLWTDRQLAEAAAIPQGELTKREREFLDASGRNARRRRLLRRAGVAGFLASLALVYGGMRLKAHLDRENAVEAQLRVARVALDNARSAQAELEGLRRHAFELFDQKQRAHAEEAWRAAIAARARRDAAFSAASGEYEKATAIGPGDAAVRTALADFLYQRALVIDDPGRYAELRQRLQYFDDGSRLARLDAPATLRVRTPAQIAAIVGFTEQPAKPAEPEMRLAPGTYALTFAGGTRLVVGLERGETVDAAPPLPAKPLPRDFVFVPEGSFLFGAAEDESVREFFNTPPIHRVRTGAYLIARHETTWADWIAFLEATGDRKHTPHVGDPGLQGQLDLRKTAQGWQLTLNLGGKPQTLREGEPLRLARDRRGSQDWRKLPVAGVSRDDGRAYAAWLSSSGRVPGARLCTEHEWERAARGADARAFPHGDRAAPDDFDFDVTYGKSPASFGPDEVGSHPRSRSPYGVDDLAGNVWEWVDSSVSDDEGVARGGSYYSAANTCRTTNRELPEPSFRAPIVGLRICADAAPVLR